MRAPLELVVRPFVVSQITNPLQPSIPTDQAATTAQNTVLDIGGDEVTTWSGNYSQTVTFYFIKKPKEKKKAGGAFYDPYAPDGVNDPLIQEPAPP
jgi:hypothetical protein